MNLQTSRIRLSVILPARSLCRFPSRGASPQNGHKDMAWRITLTHGVAFNADQTVREVAEDIAERVGASFPMRIWMCFERGGAHFKHTICEQIKRKAEIMVFSNDAGNMSTFEICLLYGYHIIFSNVFYKLSKLNFRIFYQF